MSSMKTQIVDKPGSLLQYLFTHFPDQKKTKLKQLLKFGSVTVNGIAATHHLHALKPGDKIDFLTKESALQKKLVLRLGFPILFEDDSLIIIDKPAGLLTMGTDDEKIRTVYYRLTTYIQAESRKNQGRIFIVHRLDREASGLLVFAKTEAVKRTLQESWDKVVKKYYAVVEGTPRLTSDTIESYLVEDKFRRVYSVGDPRRDSKHAVTRYTVIRKSARLSLLDVHLVTGRKNQIRVHLADIGHPIIGDEKYGSRMNPIRRLGLHAHYLSFRHPATGRQLHFESRLPQVFARLFVTHS